jgi:hypothetical protein
VKWLYAHQHPASPPTPSPNPIELVGIADTHSQQPNLPHSGDILINAGDLTNNGTFEESQFQLTWLNTLPHPHKIVIAGNHDLLFDKTFHAVHKIPELKASEVSGLYWGFIRYLEHSLTTVNVKARSVRIYGAPHTPKYGNSAFQYPRSSSPRAMFGARLFRRTQMSLLRMARRSATLMGNGLVTWAVRICYKSCGV